MEHQPGGGPGGPEKCIGAMRRLGVNIARAEGSFLQISKTEEPMPLYPNSRILIEYKDPHKDPQQPADTCAGGAPISPGSASDA